MSAEPHERPEFANAATYTVEITVVVAGGARVDTARRRAERVAEQLANAAVRARHTVEVSARLGASFEGEALDPHRVAFSAGNTGRDGPEGKHDRWVDPERRRGLESLAEANRRDRARRRDDRRRRLDVGCRDASQSAATDRAPCRCVYCRPDDHALAHARARSQHAGIDLARRCVCGRATPLAPNRCAAHMRAELIALDGDPEVLVRLVDQDRAVRNGRDIQRPEPPGGER